MNAEPRRDGLLHYEIRVGWADCDPADIAYTGAIPRFALEAIDYWWEATIGDGWFQMRKDRNMGTPFVHLSMDFRSPTTPRHRLICAVKPVSLGRTSIGFSVAGYQNDILCFEGTFVSVFVQPPGLNKTQPPEDIEALIRPMIAAQAGRMEQETQP
ncbi:MAG: acyl-CoA thioesterase [Pseudomonadota bacterium]